MSNTTLLEQTIDEILDPVFESMPDDISWASWSDETKAAIHKLLERSYKEGFSDGQDSLLHNGQITLVTDQDVRRKIVAVLEEIKGHSTEYGSDDELGDVVWQELTPTSVIDAAIAKYKQREHNK